MGWDEDSAWGVMQVGLGEVEEARDAALVASV